MYSGYKTRLVVTIRQFPFAPDTFYAFTAVLSILSRPPLKRRLTLRSAAVRTRDLSARGLLGAGHDPKSSEPRGEEAPSSRPRSDTLSGVLYNRAATLLSYVAPSARCNRQTSYVTVDRRRQRSTVTNGYHT